MKTLKKILKEAISTSALDNRLNPLRQAAKPGMKGATGEYIDTLELSLDWLAGRTNAGDTDFNDFIDKVNPSSPSSFEKPSSTVQKSPSPKRKKAKEVETKPETSPAAEKEPEEKEPTRAVTPPPIPSKVKPEEPKSKSIPSLSSLASAELGKEVPEPQAPGPEDVSTPEAEKEVDKKKTKKSSEKMPSLGSLEGSERVGLGVDPGSINSQEWVPGKKVHIGFVKDPFVVMGGDSTRGWLVKDKYGRRYVFMPSKHPKLGRGLYRLRGK